MIQRGNASDTKFIAFTQSNVPFVPIDSDEALQRATLVRSDPSLVGVTRRNIATLSSFLAQKLRTADSLQIIYSVK